MVMVLFACYTLTEVLRVSSSTWLSVWTAKSTSKSYKPGFYILVYGILSFGQVCQELPHNSPFPLVLDFEDIYPHFLDSGNCDTDQLFLVNHFKSSGSQKIA